MRMSLTPRGHSYETQSQKKKKKGQWGLLVNEIEILAEPVDIDARVNFCEEVEGSSVHFLSDNVLPRVVLRINQLHILEKNGVEKPKVDIRRRCRHEYQEQKANDLHSSAKILRFNRFEGLTRSPA